MKLTRQGVRNLDHIQGKSIGRKLEAPPVIEGFCKHPNPREINQGYVWFCPDCGLSEDIYKGR